MRLHTVPFFADSRRVAGSHPQRRLRVVTLGAVAVLATLLGAPGCAALYDLGDYAIGGDEASDGGVGPAAPHGPTAEGSAPDAASSPDAPTTGCTRNADCATVATVGTAAVSPTPQPAVCVRATGTCATLVNETCPRVVGDWANDDAVVLGALLGRGDEASPSALERAAELAVNEINLGSGVSGLPPAKAGGSGRPLVLLACDAEKGVTAARHLVDTVHVPAILGPTVPEQVLEITQQVSAPGGTLVVSPTAVASSIANLADGDLTWRAVPSDAQRAKLVIQQLNDLETLLKATRGLTAVKLAVAHGTDAAGGSARDAISGKLILNGRFLADAANAQNVSLDAYAPGSSAALAGLATKYATFRPDLVYVTSAEQVSGLVVPLEQALTAARAPARPYYLFAEVARGPELLDAIGTGALPPDLRRRVRGVRFRSDAASEGVLAAYAAAYAARYGDAPPAGTAAASALTYDVAYAVAYALAGTAGEAPTGASVARGLRALQVGDEAPVGASAVASSLRSIVERRSVALRGTHSLLRWDASGDLAAGSVEVWCVGAAGGGSYGTSGLAMDVMTQVIGGAFVQCQ